MSTSKLQAHPLLREGTPQLSDSNKNVVMGLRLSIPVAARSKARTVFACSNTEIVGSNPTTGMDVCVCSGCAHSVSIPCGGG
jgi:hypothetical protein